ncbi:hypothetical protein DFH09DRAFT_1361011 [Mycena vulgaris]|nr:hypothetical protein DFH09DRAFT_1361011 [Mycena vulgaris]
MHPSLGAENINHLPRALRLKALSAADLNGALEDVYHLSQIADKIPSDQALLLLPVVYRNLDVSLIPTTHQMDSTRPISSTLIGRPIAALVMLGLIPAIPSPVFVDFWLSVWSWCHFLHTYSDFLENPPGEKKIGVQLLKIIGVFSADEAAFRLINHTPGVRIVVARTWDLLMNTRSSPSVISHAWLRDLCGFLSRCDGPSTYPFHLAEFAEGAGGDEAQLALLVVRHITGLILARHTLSPNEIGPFFTVIHFTMKILAYEPGRSLGRQLLSNGMVGAMVNAINCMHEIAMMRQVFPPSFMLIEKIAEASSNSRGLAEALDSDFLRSLVLAGTLDHDTQRKTNLKFYFRDYLPRSTVYYSVASRLEHSILAVKTLQAKAAFRNCPAFTDWADFVRLSDERAEVLRYFESDRYMSKTACGNVECCAIRRSTDFRRCSICQKVVYCSTQCQARDWAVGHRRECSQLFSARLQNPDPLTTRERSFMRAVLHHNYMSEKHAIHMRQLAWMHENPGRAFYTLFDYSKGSVTVSIQPQSTLALLDARPMAARAMRSSGKMALHVMLVDEGGKPRRRIFPMHSDGSQLHDGLVAIASDIAHEDDLVDLNGELNRRVQELLELAVEEIH